MKNLIMGEWKTEKRKNGKGKTEKLKRENRKTEKQKKTGKQINQNGTRYIKKSENW